MSHTDPTAFYGCGHCEIEGELNISHNAGKVSFVAAKCKKIERSCWNRKWIRKGFNMIEPYR